jgi:hypothetical protein
VTNPTDSENPRGDLRPYSPKHLSFSQYTSYLRCGKAYELERIEHAPSLPAWWFLGGSTVHEVTEEIDLDFPWILREQDVTIIKKVTTMATITKLDDLVEKQRAKSEIPPESWNSGKNAQYDWWVENAPLMVERWVDWRFSTGWEIAVLDGAPAIEMDFVVQFGGIDFPIKPDRIFRLPSGALAVLDLKTGSSKPKSALQPGTYAEGMALAGLERPQWGYFWDARKGEHSSPIPLDKYTRTYLDAQYGPALTALQTGIFLPNVDDHCRICSVGDACYSNDGSQSSLYDRLDPNYVGDKP